MARRTTTKSRAMPIPVGRIEQRILLIRGQRVLLDADLAQLYGVKTKRLNEQIRRNAERFPEDFMFRLTARDVTPPVHPPKSS